MTSVTQALSPIHVITQCTRSILRNRYFAGVVFGLALSAAFPMVKLWPLAWLIPGLLAATVIGCNGIDAFRIGYIAGLAHWLSTLYWLLLIPVAWYPILGWLALSAYLAIYTATWTWLINRIVPTKSGPCIVDVPGWVQSIYKVAQVPWLRRFIWAVMGAVIWVALEMARARVLTGFPWLPLGASQYKLVSLIQISTVTGVYGVSFVVVWCSLAIILAWGVAAVKRTAKLSWVCDLVFPGAVLLTCVLWGNSRLVNQPPNTQKITIAMVQPSIPQTMIWDATENTTRFAKLIELSKSALESKPHLLVWPEAALPSFDEISYAAITNLVRTHRVWMIFGTDEVEACPSTNLQPEYNYYNSAVLVSPNGEFVETYRKRRLVMFGEYVPLSKFLPFMRHFTPIQAGFTPGKKPVQFELADPGAKIAVLICFEDIFPGLARESVNDETDFLLNLTNNGWFRESAAQWQHAVTALFRAVENGVPLVRCSNNGLTCWVDAYGRIRQIFRDKTGSIYGSGIMTAHIPVADPDQARLVTFYTKHGDLFGWGCIVVSLGAFVTMSSIRRR